MSLFLRTILVLLIAFAAGSVVAEDFYINARPVKIEEIRGGDIRAFLTDDWAKFEKYAGEVSDMMSGKSVLVYWYMQITPPLPTNWPPQEHRSVTYYAYAEYQELLRHGPSLHRSAPWAKVVLNEGVPANKEMLAVAIGPAVHGEGSVLISPEMAHRKIQIIQDGEMHLSSFVSWKKIPDDEIEIKAIREYYCQWALTNRTAELVKNNHRAYFEWLSCPSNVKAPVLP
ncbi:MAG: hypothetical protein JOY84_11560 [Curvibacter sp.]|nr:hypothetical protein [Curvibacter sp.]